MNFACQSRAPAMQEDEGSLLRQLDRILSADPLLDEVGFVHPTQLTSLHEASSPSSIDRTEIPTTHPSSFWCADHKLAISTEAVAPLYRAAKSAFIATRAEYQSHLSKSNGYPSAELDSTVQFGSTEADSGQIQRSAKRLLSYTRAVVVLNSGYKTAWDVRKQIFKNLSMIAPLEELQLSSLALSFNPKSEEAWAHRRWTIRSRVKSSFLGQISDHLLQEESKLIAIIAERSRMNYRAWRHCCWLVSWMSPSQVLQELQRWKEWAQLHVADNCSFHFRRCLFQRLLTKNKLLEVKDAWLDEMEWNKGLIELYIGREALWVHRRFLFIIWVQYLQQMDGCYPRQQELTEKNDQDQHFLQAEIMFANACIAIYTDDDNSEDEQKHLVFASTFKLWVLLKWKESPTNLGNSQVWCKEFRDAVQLLQLKAPLHRNLWEDLLENFNATPDETSRSEEYFSGEKIKQPC